ncbi:MULTISPECIES: AAA family ATPase [unclassified Flavobacterium]|uniref:AAA family ATPase n=1 Tax=unclassified Flavobacterium TaxID=196869 RepID=UPI003F8DEC0E
MKICKIKFKNIHALKGEHSIDFENGILGEAGLFVITGATGTGKSTLLDIITLALYNRIPRIDKAISESVIEEQGVILTKNAPDCYAEVEYEVKGIRYLSSWSIRRTRTGSLDKRKQELVDVASGAIIVSGVQEVIVENERIIGLNYNQFVQSMILAQGQFSKLLLAKKDERNALLEEITGSSIYRKIGKAVFQRFRAIEDAVKTQTIKMGETVLMAPEIVKEIQEDILAQKPLLVADEAKKKEYEVKKIVKENIVKNKKLKAENEISWDLFLKEKETFLPQLKQLEVHDSVVIYKEQLLAVETADKTLISVVEKIKSAKDKLVDNEKEKSNLLLAATDLVKTEVSVEKFEEVIVDFRTQVLKLKESESEKLNQVKQQLGRIEDKLLEANRYGLALVKNETLEQQIKDNLKHIEIQIGDRGIKTVLAVKEKKEELNKLILPAIQLIGDRRLFDEKNKAIGELQAKIKKQLAQIEVLALSDKQQQENLCILLPAVEKGQKELNEWQQRKSLDEHRHDLKEGEACPLCGSQTHPFASEVSETLVETLNEKQQALNKQLDQLKKEIFENGVKYKELQKLNATDTLDLENRITEFNDLQAKITQWCLQLKWTIDDQLETWERELLALQKELGSLDQLERHIQAKSILNEMQQLFQKYIALKADFTAAKEELRLIYDKKDVNEDTNALLSKFILCRSNLKSLTEQLKDYEKSKADTIDEKEQLLAMLMPELLGKGISTLADLKSKILEEKTANQLRTNWQALNQQEIRLQANKEKVEKDLNEDQKLDDATISLESLLAELPKLTEAISILQKHIWKQEQQLIIDNQNKEKLKESQLLLDALNKDLALWAKMNLLIGDATGKKFSNFVQDLTLKQLLEYGNQRLVGFSDRYLLDTSNDTDGLKVIDTYMGNTKRSVSSLSGGETFKLSLALAFGLSDLAAQNVAIESLFIDEGFGSLDPESLDQAISILENMQNESNKSIGIISHVGELKDRIGTKIKLVRTGAGYSTIEIE